jgi:hypothetical protein
MVLADTDVLKEARALKSSLKARLFGVDAAAASAANAGWAAAVPDGSNVVGVGYGAKVTVGAGLDELAVRVYVRTKLPLSELADADRVPGDVDGVPTDVIQVGDIMAFARPGPCGMSVGHVAITAGTAGCLVTIDSARGTFILSNNHVLADSNAANVGDHILEPGPLDGGQPNNPIAELSDFEKIAFGGPPNAIDAAIARLIDPTDMTPDIAKIGRVVDPPVAAALYQSVRKHGRTTRHTVGVVMDLSADIRVRYGTQVAEFEDQIAIVGAGGPFSDGGDSGSLIVDAVTKQPVALLFAGGGATTFGCPISPVLARFGATIV